ncbi:MAG: Na+:solute symporter [Rhodothermaceae bacterium]|nr:Na+:solute symporter [Rhodothermaceae bacterium]
MTPLDWTIVATYLVLSLGIAAWYARRASKNTDEFFASGRAMPWWLAGTSMVATTFAADTPLLITEVIALDGISGNWIWWNGALGGILTVFFFAKLWRRSGVLTDVEFVELRYSGPAAAWLRGIKAVYFGLLMNAIIIGWVALAMETILAVLFPGMRLFGQETLNLLGLEVGAPMATVGLLILLVGAYSLLSGLWGIAVTDVFQFALAMIGSVALAWFALDLPEIGGVSGLLEKLPAETVRFFPVLGGGEAAEAGAVFVISALAFVAFFGVQWWSSWYPGQEPGGGGYVAQRMLAARSEKDSALATLWFTVAHYCVRPWPWILVALVALVLYPGLENPREGYVLVMRETLPPGLLGLLFAAFLAAFMSTISTQLNWGTSYLVNDLYRRFVAKTSDEKHYVLISRLVTFGLALFGFLVATQLDTIRDAWGLVLSASAGLGLVLILRWYWARVNAWSELTATLVPLGLVGLQLVGVDIPFLTAEFPVNLYGIVAITTVLWLAVTFLTRPTDPAVLDAFYRTIRPGGPGWHRVARSHPEVQPDSGLGRLALRWALGVALVYAALLGTGWLLFGRWGAGLLALGAAAAVLIFLVRDLDQAT